MGWGSVLNRLLFPGESVDWGQKASWGIALSILAGGILNVTALISRPVILTYIIAGIVWWISDLVKSKRLSRSNLRSSFSYLKRFHPLVIILVFLLLLTLYGGWVTTKRFNAGDDLQGYFVFPQKMLQTGTMGDDPFSERRLITSLGGQSFLHTFVLCLLPEEHLNLIDPSIGLLIAAAILLGYLRKTNISNNTAAFVIIFFAAMPPPKVNITALVIVMPLFIAIYRLMIRQDREGPRFQPRAIMISLLAAAICCLKSSFIPTCAVFIGMYYLFSLVDCRSQKRKSLLFEFLVVVCLIFLFLAPWMISMHGSSGTFLYPIFGKGYHGGSYDEFKSHWEMGLPGAMSVLLKYIISIPYLLFLLLAAIYLLYPKTITGSGVKEYRVLLSLAVGSGLGALILVISIQGVDRYSFPFMLVATVLLMVNILKQTKYREKKKGLNLAVISFLLLGAVLLAGHHTFWSKKWKNNFYPRLLENIRYAFSESSPGSRSSKKDVSRYINVQRSIPEGEVVLARVTRPSLLDFRRNKIFIMGSPGGSSLPPGMPFFKGSDAMVDYLLSKSLRYVAYSYGYDKRRRKKYLQLRGSSTSWIKTHSEHMLAFYHHMLAISAKRKKLYDDGYTYVLDLNSKD